MNKIIDFIEGILVVVMGLLSLVDGIRLDKLRGVRIQYDILGPGNYSVGLGIVMIILGLVYMIPHPGKSFAAEKPVDKGLRRKMIHMIVILVVYGFLMNIIGYLLASIVFFILMFRVVGFRPWPTILGLSIVFSISYYIIFVRLLGMVLPSAILIP